MKKLHFKTTDEFEILFKNKTRTITDAVVSSIEDAMQKKDRTAILFEITFEEVDIFYEVSLPQSQWPQALQQCLDHYHELGLADEQIDTWKLLEAAKVW